MSRQTLLLTERDSTRLVDMRAAIVQQARRRRIARRIAFFTS